MMWELGLKNKNVLLALYECYLSDKIYYLENSTLNKNFINYLSRKYVVLKYSLSLETIKDKTRD
jgi:hypothetical protein